MSICAKTLLQVCLVVVHQYVIQEPSYQHAKNMMTTTIPIVQGVVVAVAVLVAVAQAVVAAVLVVVVVARVVVAARLVAVQAVVAAAAAVVVALLMARRVVALPAVVVEAALVAADPMDRAAAVEAVPVDRAEVEEVEVALLTTRKSALDVWKAEAVIVFLVTTVMEMGSVHMRNATKNIAHVFLLVMLPITATASARKGM